MSMVGKGFTLSVAGGSQLKPADSAVRTEKPAASLTHRDGQPEFRTGRSAWWVGTATQSLQQTGESIIIRN
jgi:hypothetical protein